MIPRTFEGVRDLWRDDYLGFCLWGAFSKYGVLENLAYGKSTGMRGVSLEDYPRYLVPLQVRACAYNEFYENGGLRLNCDPNSMNPEP